MPTLLIVDDERNVLYSLEKSLKSDELEILTAQTAREGIELVRSRHPDAVICDVRLPDISGLDAFEQMRELDPRLPVIIITAHTTTDTAIEAMKRGAFDYLLKPYELTELRAAVGKALEVSRLSRVPAVFDQDSVVNDDPVDRIVGTSSAMQSVYKEIGRVAPQNVNVLILGESGTGKELVARAIYQHSSRQEAAFMAINCAAIPETLLESELFGHEKGAFTGADRRRIGKFEQANHGTIFLDEIGDMSLPTQAKVLRVLQDGRFERVGGNETVQADVRVIAATNVNLDEAIARKAFRQDLFYRLNTFTIRLPALRERPGDLPRLVEYFAARFSRDLGKPIQGISPQAMQLVQQHDWPGNVRELQSAIKYAIVRATGDILTPDCLPENVRPETGRPTDGRSVTEFGHDDESQIGDVRAYVRSLIDNGETGLQEKVHRTIDRVLFEEVLEHVDGHQANASELLGISRTTFRARLQALGITIKKAVSSNEQTQDNDLAGGDNPSAGG